MSRKTKILKGYESQDYVHLLVSSPPVLSPAKIVQYLNGRSSQLVQQDFSHLKKRYWTQHLWARGYFCSTIREITTEQLKEYIEGHNKEDPGEQFTIGTEYEGRFSPPLQRHSAPAFSAGFSLTSATLGNVGTSGATSVLFLFR